MIDLPPLSADHYRLETAAWSNLGQQKCRLIIAYRSRGVFPGKEPNKVARRTTSAYRGRLDD
jgi:hypothetical protein